MGGGIARTVAQCGRGETGLRPASQCCSHVTRLIWCRLCMLFSSSLLILLLLFCDPDSGARRAAAVGMSADADGEYDADGGYVYVSGEEQGEDDVSGLQQFWPPGLPYPSTELEDRGELGVQSPLRAQVLGPVRHCHYHCPPGPALPWPVLPAFSLGGARSLSPWVGRLVGRWVSRSVGRSVGLPPCSSCLSLTSLASFPAPCPGEPEPGIGGDGGGEPGSGG